jgi:HlyD family secretion protein
MNMKNYITYAQIFKFTGILCSLLFLNSACNRKANGIKPTLGSITESVYASGIVLSENQYQVFANTNGVLTDLYVDEGDTVGVGTELFMVFNEVSTLNSENALLAAQNAQIQNNQARIDDLKIQIQLAKQKYIQDSILYGRQKRLWEQNVGTQLQVEQSQLNFKASKASYYTSILKLQNLEKDLKLNASQSLNNYKIALQMKQDFKIKSEINGKVYKILKKKGEMISVQTPIAIVGDSKNFLIELQIDEYDITKIQLGQMVYLKMDSYKESVFEAKISKINPIMNEKSKSFVVEAIFVKAPPLLYPNLSVEASILIAKKEKALSIPRKYLINDEFVVKSNGDTCRVVTGLKDFKKVEIISGLTENDELKTIE